VADAAQSVSDRPVIVGAGPAGVRAAERLVEAGLSPIVIDEGVTAGGQIYRRPPAILGRSARDLYGSEAAKADSVHQAFARLGSRITHHPGTTVWNIRPGVLHTVRDRRFAELAFRDVILATGAMDRVIPLPGWTLPGVYSLGGAQIALKAQGAGIGQRVVFIGTGPLLWLCALQYAKAGATVMAVIDTTPLATSLAALRALRYDPRLVWRGLGLMAGVHRRGIRTIQGGAEPAIARDREGTRDILRVTVRHDSPRRGTLRSIPCDAVALGFGVKPEAQLAELAGVPFAFDQVTHAWLPQHDGTGRTAVPGVYLAGDGAGIAGADAAEVAGRRAACALLADRGLPVDRADVAWLDAWRMRNARVRAALEAAFPFPAHLAQGIADETILCRCESISGGALREAARTGPAPEINRAKALTRIGMGRCQGRVCGPAAAEVLAAAIGVPVAQVGALRAQPPIKPIPITA